MKSTIRTAGFFGALIAAAAALVAQAFYSAFAFRRLRWVAALQAA